nr:hypothetical protein Iba_chr12bCG3270 [Ipomoea batatas]GME01299.1 hypothetical protein Iba_scaffold1677319CG0010 [Ipomoea batatas]
MKLSSRFPILLLVLADTSPAIEKNGRLSFTPLGAYFQPKRTYLLPLHSNPAMASGEDTKGTDVVCTGKPRRRISQVQGDENAWLPDFVPFKAVPGALNPNDPTDNLMNA